MEIESLDFDSKEDIDRWQNYILSRSDTHCTDWAQWRLFIKELYGFNHYSFACIQDGTIAGVVSLYHIPSPLIGNMLVTSPFFGYGGLYADSNSVRDALLEKVEHVAVDLKVDFIEFRLRDSLPAPYQSNTDFLEHDLQLLETPEDVWENRLSSNTRQNIRKSQKKEMAFTLTKDYRHCYKLLCHTLRAHGTPFHNERFFKLLLKHFEQETYFSEVRHEGDLEASGIVMQFGNNVITPYIGSLQGKRNYGSNYCQYWGIIKECFDRGVTCFEFGRSPKDSIHSKYKQKWGVEIVRVQYNYRIMNPAYTYSTVGQPSKLFLMASAIWKYLPLVATNAIGHRVFRYVP